MPALPSIPNPGPQQSDSKLAAQVSVLSASLANAQAQIKRLVAAGYSLAAAEESALLRRYLEGALQAAQTHVATGGALRAQLAEAMDVSAAHLATAEVLRALHDEATAEVGRLRAQLDEAQAQVADLQSRNAAMLASTSWRIAAPVRAIGGLFKRKPQA